MKVDESEPNQAIKESLSRRLWSTRRQLEVLVLVGIALTLLALMVPFIQHLREEARRTQSKNNLKQIGLALYNYHDVHSCLPPGGSIREDGTPHHGWMTSIMPYLDSSPLYSMIDFNYAWDHPFNVDVFAHQNPAFISPSITPPPEDGLYSITHTMGNPAILHRNSSVSLDDLKEGAAHSWLAGEVIGGFQPEAYPFNWREWNGTLNQSPIGYGRPDGSGAMILVADASIRYVSTKHSSEVWKTLSKHEPKPRPELIAIPPRTFPGPERKVTAGELSGGDSKFPLYSIFVGDKKYSATIRAFPFDRSEPPPLDATDVRDLVESFSGLTQLTFHGGLDAEICEVLLEFKSLSVLYAAWIDVDSELITHLKRCVNLEELHLKKLDGKSRQLLEQELPALRLFGPAIIPELGKQSS